MGVTNRLKMVAFTNLCKVKSDPEDAPDAIGMDAIDHFAPARIFLDTTWHTCKPNYHLFAAAQREILGLLLETVKPSNLAIPSLCSPASRYRPKRVHGNFRTAAIWRISPCRQDRRSINYRRRAPWQAWCSTSYSSPKRRLG